MNTERPRLNLEVNYKLDPEKTAEQVLNWQGEHPFEEYYRKADDYEAKFSIAVALIGSSRYLKERKPFLAQSFIPQGGEVSDEVQSRKDHLDLMLISEGILDLDSEEAVRAENSISAMVKSDKLLESLKGVLPEYVRGAIASSLLFQDVSDEEKLARLRSITTRSLIRPYLGELVVPRPLGELDLRDIFFQVPEKIFRDPDGATYQIIKHFFENEVTRLFMGSEEGGLRRLEEMIVQEPTGVKRDFLLQIQADFQEIHRMSIPDVFVDQVKGWFTETSPFPLFRQKYFAHRFLETKRRLLYGQTGATKTASSYLAMEAAGAEKVLVVGPAKARNAWPREAKKIYRPGFSHDVFAVKKRGDLEDERMRTAKYVFVSTELMSQAWADDSLHNKLIDALVKVRQTDGIIFDESDEIRDPKRNKTRMIANLMESIREAYEAQPGRSPLPMIAATATPIVAEPSDLDVTMALLFPQRFALPGDLRRKEEEKHTFSEQGLNDPLIGHSLLFGEQLMIRWTLADLFGERVPRLSYEVVVIPLTPSQRVFYEYVAGIPLGVFEKTQLMRSAILNPEMVKKRLQERGKEPEAVYSKEELVERFVELYEAWKEWIREKDPQILDESFSADWIAKYGERDLLTQCHFDDQLPCGVESLVEQFPEIRKDWQSSEGISGTYQRLRQFLQETIIRENGEIGFETKTFIVSPYKKRGVTRQLGDLRSLYEQIHSVWLNEVPKEMVINIDGSRSFSERDRHAALWRERGDKNCVVLASMQSVNESMDWAVRETDSNRDIKGVNVIFLGWPWGWDEFEQMSGRFLRPGQAKPVKIFVLEGEYTIDHGLFALNRRKRLTAEMMVTGVPPGKEDREFLKQSTSERRLYYVPSVGQALVWDVIRRFKGRGEEEAIRELGREKEGKTFFELWAEAYYNEGQDEFRLAGHNAELAKNIALQDRPRHVLVLGAGTCLFNRKLLQAGYRAEVVNVDINREAIRIAKEVWPGLGEAVVGRASRLGDEHKDRYDLVECSFMLPWTNLDERVRILDNINRAGKFGSRVILAFPESTFDQDTFVRFTQVLQDHFGFLLLDPSGMSFAIDIKPKRRIGWIMTLGKRANSNIAGLDPRDLAFLTDERVVISKYRPKKKAEPQIIPVEFAICSPKAFEVYNPITGRTSTANSGNRISFNDWAREFRPRLSESQLGIWNQARRMIEKGLGVGYTDAESILALVLHEAGLDTNKRWEMKTEEEREGLRRRVEKLVAIEIRRRAR